MEDEPTKFLNDTQSTLDEEGNFKKRLGRPLGHARGPSLEQERRQEQMEAE